MTISAPHFTHFHLGGIGSAVHWLSSAATVGPAPESDYRPARYLYLERAEMFRESEHL